MLKLKQLLEEPQSQAGRRFVVPAPTASRILELSTKCEPGRAFQVAAETRGSAQRARHSIISGKSRETKTRAALELRSRRPQVKGR